MRRKNPIADTLERLELRIDSMLRANPLTEAVLGEAREFLATTKQLFDFTKPEAHSELLPLTDQYASILIEFIRKLQGLVGELEERAAKAASELSETRNLLRTKSEALEASERFAKEVEDLILDEGKENVFRRIHALASELITRLDALLTDGFAIEAETLEIQADASEILPKIAKTSAALDQQLALLSLRAAPLVVRRDQLVKTDLSVLEELIPRVEAARVLSDKLYGELDDLERRCAGTAEKIRDWETGWLDERRMLDAAELVFPRISGYDLYALAETTVEIVGAKRKQCVELFSKIRLGLKTAQKTIGLKIESVRAAREQVRARLAELEDLKHLLHVPGYDALPNEARDIVKIIVLSFRDTNISIPQINDLMSVIIDAPQIDEEGLVGLVSLPYFVPRGDPRFKSYSLTELGLYWQERWRREFSEILKNIEDGWKRVDELENQRKEESRLAREARAAKLKETRQRQETEALERETRARLREIELYDEVRIKEKICRDGLDEILQVIYSLRENLPGPRDSSQWAKILAAAYLNGLIRPRDRRVITVARGLARLFSHKPPLFQMTDGSGGKSVFAFNEIGIKVCLLLPAFPQTDVDRFMQMLGKEQKWWGPREKKVVNQFFARYQAAREAMPPTCIE